MIIYLAAPFFTSEQMGLVCQVETTIQAAGHDLLSPRRRGPILQNLGEAERKTAAAKVFSTNCLDIESCNAVLAVIDDRDPGTIWEMGFAYHAWKTIYSFTNKDYGLNVMMQGCIAGHARGIAQLAEMMRCVKEDRSVSKFSVEAAT
jgi:nucleoside deoxyribosyltransferase